MKSCQNSDCQMYGAQVDDAALFFCDKCGSRLAATGEQQKPVPSAEQLLKTVSCRYNYRYEGKSMSSYNFKLFFKDLAHNFNPDIYSGKLSVYSNRIEFEIDTERHKSIKNTTIIIERKDMLSVKTLLDYPSLEIIVPAEDNLGRYDTEKWNFFTNMQSYEEAVEICNLIKNLKG